MRIGCYTNCYRPRINGVVRSISVYRQALLDAGHRVFLFAPDAPHYLDAEEDVYRYPTLPLESGKTYRIPISYWPGLFHFAVRLHLDVVHAHHSVFLGREAARVARASGVPLVCTVHSRYDRYGEPYRLGGDLVRWASRVTVTRYMRRCQRIIAPTSVLRDVICQDLPDMSERVVVIPTPLHDGAFERPDAAPIRARYGLEGCFTFVVTARLTAEKGLSDLLKAVAVVRRQRADVRLLILGDGPEREHLEQEAAELGVADAVTFTGMVPFEQVGAYLQAADAFAFASQMEVQPLVLNEAMAAGLPVVAYDAPFVRDVITDGQNGLLSAPDYRALASQMEVLAGRRDLCLALSREAVRTASRFRAPEAASRLLGVYQEAIEELARDEAAVSRRRRRPGSTPRRPAVNSGG